MRRVHAMDPKNYYDQFLKKMGEGVCEVCEKPTKYRCITVGYLRFCSIGCASKAHAQNMSGSGNSNFSAVVTESTRAKMRLRKQLLYAEGYVNPMKGKNRSLESMRPAKEMCSRLWKDPSWRRHMLDVFSRRPKQTLESNEKRRKSCRKRWNELSACEKKKRSDRTRLLRFNPKFQAAMHSEKMLAHYAKLGVMGTARPGKSKNTYTKLEQRVALLLDQCNYVYEWNKTFAERFRPDFMLCNRQVVIQAHGCFWHGCSRCFPVLNYRLQEENQERDERFLRLCASRDVNVLVLWECDVNKDSESVLRRITDAVEACIHKEDHAVS